jgi:hypothetical protein
MTNITSGHVRAFQAVRSQIYDNITLASCTINDEPGVAIVIMDEVGEGKIAVMPLFVSITPGMELAFPELGESSGEGGGPTTTRQAFERGKTMTTPAPA